MGKCMYFNNKEQSFAKKQLTNAIKSNLINHAYIFSGIEGVGKLECAQEFSRILLDAKNLSDNPDYKEIKVDGSSIKISQIRNFQNDIVLRLHHDSAL